MSLGDSGGGAPHPGGGREPRGPVPLGASLEVCTGFYEGLAVPLDRPWLVVGRGRTVEIPFAEPTLSRAHVGFGFDGESFFVRDLGSTNGTLVNGIRSDERGLAEGDEVQIGRLVLRFHAAPRGGGNAREVARFAAPGTLS